jgi:hypothetical protein
MKRKSDVLYDYSKKKKKTVKTPLYGRKLKLTIAETEKVIPDRCKEELILPSLDVLLHTLEQYLTMLQC